MPESASFRKQRGAIKSAAAEKLYYQQTIAQLRSRLDALEGKEAPGAPKLSETQTQQITNVKPPANCWERAPLKRKGKGKRVEKSAAPSPTDQKEKSAKEAKLKLIQGQ